MAGLASRRQPVIAVVASFANLRRRVSDELTAISIFRSRNASSRPCTIKRARQFCASRILTFHNLIHAPHFFMLIDGYYERILFSSVAADMKDDISTQRTSDREPPFFRSAITRFLRGTAFHCLLPIIKVGIILGCRLGYRYHCWTLYRCRFYGPPMFLDQCREAMNLLSQTDLDLHKRLTGTKLICWYDPTGFPHVMSLCPVTKAFVAWGDRGIVACLVFSYFKTDVFYGKSVTFPFNRRDTTLAKRLVFDHVRTWLQKHGFPQELALAFKHGA